MIGCPDPDEVTIPGDRFLSLNNEWIPSRIPQIHGVEQEPGWNECKGGKRIHLLKPTILMTLCGYPEALHVHDEKRETQQNTSRTIERRQTADTSCKPPIERFSTS